MGLSAATRYVYRVRVEESGTSRYAYSNEAEANTYGSGGGATALPESPTGLMATALSLSAIHLTWTDNASDELGFKIERKLAGDADTAYREIGNVGASTGTGSAASYTDRALSPSTSYTYRVRAYNAFGNSPNYSNAATATTFAAGDVPAAPISLVATAVASDQINLAWTDRSDTEAGFVLQRTGGASSNWADVAAIAADATSYQDPGLTAGTTYTYRIRAHNAAGFSNWSNEASATTNAPGTDACADDISLTSVAAGTNKIALYWTAAGSYTGFHVYRSSDGGAFARITASPTSVVEAGPTLETTYRYVDTSGLTAGTDYEYYVVGVTSSGQEGCRSNIDVASPESGAVPWDTGTPAEIVAAVAAKAQAALPPDVDEVGDPIPCDVGFLNVVGPNGIIYQGNLDAVPAAMVQADGVYDEKFSTIVCPDGLNIPLPGVHEDPDDPLSGPNVSASSPGSTPLDLGPDAYYYKRTMRPTGIFRMVESVAGCRAIRATVGLPNAADSTKFALGGQGAFMSSAYVYVGGHVDFPAGTPPMHGQETVPDYPLDIGFSLDRHVVPTATEWQAYILPTGLHRAIVLNRQPVLSEVRTYMTGEIRLTFLTPAGGADDKAVIVNYRPILSGAIGVAGVTLVDEITNTTPPQRTNRYKNVSVTYVYHGVRGWRNRPYTPGSMPSGNNRFVLKRANSIAQTMNLPQDDPGRNSPSYHGDKPGAPIANAPPAYTHKGFVSDGSRVFGAYWGNADTSGLLILDPNGAMVTWEPAQTLRQGAYPMEPPYIDAVIHNPYFWESNINLKTS
jgi:hypothetical protein